MNFIRSKSVLVVAAVALGVAATWVGVAGRAGAATPQDRPGQGSAPARIAVANVPRILSELREAKDLDDKFTGEKEKLAQEEARLKEQIKNLEGRAGNFRPDSPQYEDLQNEYVDAVSKYKVWGETVKFKRETQKKRLTRMLYDKIYAAVAEYAAREGIDLVISDVQPILSEKDFAQVPLEQLGAVLNQRRVLYAGKTNDISQAIIALLDSKYRGEGAVGGAGGAGGGGGSPAATSGAGGGDARPAGDAGGPIQRRPNNK
jgi:Skp family chaperone for outer membrane proteins